MAFVVYDRVKETTTTTGTGTITLAGAVTGYQSFAVVGNGNTTYYCIAGQGTAEWEVGIGTYTSVGTTLARTTVLASSNAGSLVNFSAGTKDVFVTAPAGRYFDSAGNFAMSGALTVNSSVTANVIWSQPASGNAYVYANRASSATGSVGFSIRTAGASTWDLYVPASTSDLNFYGNGATRAVLGATGVFTNYNDIYISPSAGNAYIRFNRPSTSYESGINFATGGTIYFWNYTPIGSTSSLSWFANGANRMTLSNTGVISSAASFTGTAAYATSVASGAANQIVYQSAASISSFITAPTTASTFLQWNGSAFAWAASGGATGAGGDQVFYENGQTVTTNYTITTNKNAMSAGPITINTGVTVTVPTGSVWTIV